MVLDSARRSAMPIRLVIWRKPAEWIAMSQYWPRQLASRQQSKLDDGSLTAAEFVMLATSLPEAGCTGPLWRSCQEALAALIAAIVSPVTLHMLTNASPRMYARLANPRRRRRHAIRWPIRGLS